MIAMTAVLRRRRADARFAASRRFRRGPAVFVVDGVIISERRPFRRRELRDRPPARGLPRQASGGSQDALVNRVRISNRRNESVGNTEVGGRDRDVARARRTASSSQTKRGSASGAAGFSLNTRLGRSVAYRLLGTRQFSSVNEVETLPYGQRRGGIRAARAPSIRRTLGSRMISERAVNNGAPVV